MRLGSTSLQSLTLAAAVLGSAAWASADEAPLPASLAQNPPVAQAEKEKKWRFDAALYLWAADLEGDFTVKGLTGEADKDFGEVADALDAAFTVHFEAWNKNKVGILADVNWLAFQEENDDGLIDTEITNVLGMTEAAGAFRFGEGDATFDLFAGIRWVAIGTKVELVGIGSKTMNRDYVDPMIGARLGVDLFDWLHVSGRVDVAGFGVGTDMTGNLVGMATIRISPMFAIMGGYRSMALEITEDTSYLKFSMSGPMVAVDVGF